MKPHYRLHFHLFDGKTPLWWVSRRVSVRVHENGYEEPGNFVKSTGGYVDPARAVFEAARL